MKIGFIGDRHCENCQIQTQLNLGHTHSEQDSTRLVFLVLPGGCLLLVDEVLLDHLLLELADDGVDARPLLVVRLQPPQP